MGKSRTKITAPRLPLWVDDYLAFQVHHPEPLEAAGARTRLWCISYHQDPPGTLPTDDNQLRILAGATADQWAVIKPFLVGSWRTNRDGSRYIIERVVAEVRRVAREKVSKKHAADEKWRIQKARQEAELRARASSVHSKCNASPAPAPAPAPAWEEEGADPPERRPAAQTLTSPAKRTAPAKAPPPAAVQAYREAAHLYPPKPWWDRIVEAVPAGSEDRFRAHVIDWVGHGWKPGNVSGVLDSWAAGGIPPPRGGGPAGSAGRNEPAGYASLREWVTKSELEVETDGFQGRDRADVPSPGRGIPALQAPR